MVSRIETKVGIRAKNKLLAAPPRICFARVSIGNVKRGTTGSSKLDRDALS